MFDKDYIRASDGNGEPVRAVVTEDRGTGNMALIVDSVLNFPHKFVATTGDIDVAEGTLVNDTICVFYGHLDGSIIMIDDFAPGYNDVGNFENQVVLIKPTTAWADLVSDLLGEGGASVTISDTPPADAEAGDLWGDTNGSSVTMLAAVVGNFLIPVGTSIITTNPANPATYYGFGTWEEDTQGRTIVGVDPTQPEFDMAGLEGGEATHNHTLSDEGYAQVTISQVSGNAVKVRRVSTNGANYTVTQQTSNSNGMGGTGSEGTGAGLGGNTDSASSLQPYKTKHIWTRVA